MVDIIVVRSNSIVYNPRVGKIARSLTKKYSTCVLGWNRDGIKGELVRKYAVHLKLFNLKAPLGRPSLVMYFPLYWTWVLAKLLFSYRPKVVHACDLDSAIPCYIYKLITRKKLVFDVCDRYAMGYIPPKFKTLYSMVNSLEEFIGKNSDALVNVSKKLEETFKKRPNCSAVIMNCSEDRIGYFTDEVAAQTSKIGNVLTVVYTGNIIRNRGLEEITSVVQELDQVELIVAGRAIDARLLKQILQAPNVKYKGLLEPKDVWALQASSDVMVSLYDLNDPISYYSMGNKIFEAMMYRLPIVTNVASELIREAECGIVVDYRDKNQIKEALVSLRDNKDLRKKLGSNGRKAFLSKYNWKVMEEELYKIYDGLLKNK